MLYCTLTYDDIVTDAIMKNEISVQLCLGVILKESNLPSANRLALQNIDQAAGAALKLYASIHDLDTNTSDVFTSVLPKVQDKNLITSNEAKAIMKLHKISDGITFSNSVVETLVDEYITLVKILLAHLHNYRATKAQWAELVNNIRKSL